MEDHQDEDTSLELPSNSLRPGPGRFTKPISSFGELGVVGIGMAGERAAGGGGGKILRGKGMEMDREDDGKQALGGKTKERL